MDKKFGCNILRISSAVVLATVLNVSMISGVWAHYTGVHHDHSAVGASTISALAIPIALFLLGFLIPSLWRRMGVSNVPNVRLLLDILRRVRFIPPPRNE